jgi:hypothetical protein
MSLINRMLDDLAARQAPGAESLKDVRLSEPLGAANEGLDRRKLLVLALVAFGVAGIAWWSWPGRISIPVPQARAVPSPESVPAAPAPPPRIVSEPVAEEPPAPSTAPRLQLASRLASPPDIETSETIDEAENAGPPREPAPVAVETTPARPERLARRAPAPAAPPEPAPQTIAAPATSAPPIDPAFDHKQRARLSLADQDPAGALAAIPAAEAARDVESAALRAAALQRLGRHGEAAEAYAELTLRDPAEPGHWVGLGISLEGGQRREPARIAYRRALQSDRLAPSLRAFAQDRINALEAP